MLSFTKKWIWYDWIFVIIRTFWLIVILGANFMFPSFIHTSGLVVLPLALVVYLIPLIVRYKKTEWYPAFDILTAGCFYLYLASVAPDLLWSFILLVIIIGLCSNQKNYIWSGIFCGFVFPLLSAWIANQPPYELIVSCSLGFAIGISFNILIQYHKQSRIIEEQKLLLEQHIRKIEKLTLIEERNRLSHELHDTIGHTLTSLIAGVTSLRSSVPNSQFERIDSLISIAQHSLDDIRRHLHELSHNSLSNSLSASLQQLTEEFMKSTGTTVTFRVIGTETLLMQKVNFCLYRCLQESLTNAVRHGKASTISVQLYFDEQQLRLQIEDNGIGTEEIQFGFGLSGMKERLEQVHGTLSVHSSSEQGTFIVCNIPLQIKPAHDIIRLLVVDDQALVTNSLEKILEHQTDFIVVGKAHDGSEALKLCEQLQPDIVLMDIQMPKMNGIEALLEMKRHWPNMKIVLMTTFEDSLQAATALEHGAEGYMLKSIHPQEMKEALKLIYNGGTWIDQSVATRIFEEMKLQREQLAKIKSTKQTSPYGLTKREMEILEHLSNGLRYKSIAAKLFLSEGTIRNYCSNLYSKLGVNNREEAIKKARTENIL
ncbi:helix-turn-helix transcriptional regulator [Bacillus wiedmannii]|uniref:helix-turn-helix transcriptional regulator n=1 Tax=Bacillus wiedmannii TaxID=1890302 RepID=UPI000BECEA8A|nr:hybrid sensor histidine kinase/response regulator transcription factor [Bacillus wiedmannii]PEG11594.1 two-component system sensor histidine kinase/response regulator [Bacillus wiedmannii]PEI75945.1 two-component system sensor histidine kinase/response regulator [Bacillus wiedmannii]PEO72053.1 two-component system sensor histidine kinase/response regulator [Bacillus wiedmannii]PEO93776.1 two-component system sensor histidine kinase/response regulator [Bacillus wiedmannii]PFZ53453.1 two-comp